MTAPTTDDGATTTGPDASAPDVVVVGAGFAGATAARELSRAGRRVLVLEGRDRIGGRTWYKDVPALGRSVEIGGTWVHWAQPHLYAELTRHGAELVESIGAAAPEVVVHRTGGEIRRSETADVWPMIEQAITAYFGDDAAEVLPRPLDPFFAADRVAGIDKYNCQDRIDQLDVTAEQKDVLNAMWSLCTGSAARDGGYLAVLRWYALSWGTPQGIFDTCTRFKIRNGTRSLIEAILAESSAEVRLDSPVAAVAQDAGRATVRLRSGEEITAEHVIVAVPLNTLGDIEFTPGLSDGKVRAAAEGQASRGLKLWARVTGDLPRPLFALAPENEVLHYAHTEEIHDDGQLLVAFGPDPAAIGDVTSAAEITPHFRRLLGDDRLEVVAVDGKDWSADEFSQGAWSIPRPNQFTSYLADLQTSEGRVHLAGSDVATGWNGFIDGAIESGTTVGRRVVAALGVRA